MPRVLLVAATTGYQIRSFNDAGARLGVELLLATDRCHVLDDPWQDQAVPIRFHDEDGAVESIKIASESRPLDGVLAVGDGPAIIAAATAHALCLRCHPPDAVRVAANKLLTRLHLRDAGLPSPWFRPVPSDVLAEQAVEQINFPCVVKPLSMMASRGVIRADTADELIHAIRRVRHMVCSPTVKSDLDSASLTLLIEEYIEGVEIAVEAVMTAGKLQILAIFDKPDPLKGPFFEETIYVTPSRLPDAEIERICQTVTRSVVALGLSDGPVHAECRINSTGVFVLEIAARPIGGLCARTLRFTGQNGLDVSLEELLLRHAIGEEVQAYRLRAWSAGVMMIPVKTGGIYRRVAGLDDARQVDLIEEIVITAKQGQHIQPLPEGGSYLGFIFARAAGSDEVVDSLRRAHEFLQFEFESIIPVI